MEKLSITHLITSDPVKLSYSSPSFILFFSLKDILLIKELNKDLSSTILNPISIYIGDESKKVSLWKQKEPASMDCYNGGNNLKAFPEYKITEVPWLVIINNNLPVFSKKFTEIDKPVIKSILRQFPEFKKEKKKDLEKIVKSSKLSTDEKITLLENLSTESQTEILNLKRELEDKDKVIKGIMHKL